MVLSLQELSYVKLTPEQRQTLPEIIQNSTERLLVSRILRTWRKSNVYRTKFIRERIKLTEELTKRAIIHVIRYDCLPEELTIYSLVDTLHGFLHNFKKDEYISHKNMMDILSIFIEEADNNAHLFFGQLWCLVNSPGTILLDDKIIYIILSVLSKEVLTDLYLTLSK